MKTYSAHRKGVAIFAAIAFMLVMATIMGLMVSMTSKTTKRTADIYFYEQAHLLAKSATEHALLAISAHDRNATTGCVNQINSTYGGTYLISTTIRYIGMQAFCGGLPISLIDNIVTPESNGTVLIDVFVTTNATAGLDEPVRFHRRTMQKP